MGVRQLTARLRTRLPARIVAGLRLAALAWGMATARWRMLPDVIVVGAQRSGTTTLFHLLEQHPSMVRATLNKGTGYFDDDFARGVRWYRAHFPLRVVARLRTGRRRPLTFEISGYYLFHPLAAERLAATLPGVKVVAMVRDPVVRAHSAHRHEFARGFETEEFPQALAAEPHRLAGVEEDLTRNPGTVNYAHRHHAYVGRGQYGPQLQRYVDQVGPHRLHVIEAERFFADPIACFGELQAWLGLERWDPEEVPVWNARPRLDMDPETRNGIRALFEESDAQLTEILTHPPAWLDSEARGTDQPC